MFFFYFCFWIGQRENLQETMAFTIKYGGFRLKSSLKPNQWILLCYLFGGCCNVVHPNWNSPIDSSGGSGLVSEIEHIYLWGWLEHCRRNRVQYIYIYVKYIHIYTIYIMIIYIMIIYIYILYIYIYIYIYISYIHIYISYIYIHIIYIYTYHIYIYIICVCVDIQLSCLLSVKHRIFYHHQDSVQLPWLRPRPPNIVLEQLVPSAVEQPNVPGTVSWRQKKGTVYEALERKTWKTYCLKQKIILQLL
jgi:hypothetical protein